MNEIMLCMTHHKKQNLPEGTRWQISGKTLGDLAKPGACAYCFWLRAGIKAQFPHAVFPGIFSTIDSFTKNSVEDYFDREGKAPEFLDPLGQISGYIKPPSHHQFRYSDPVTEIRLTGAADGIYKLVDGTIAIVDYKTAKFTDGQENMFPVYVAQLNAYAVIAAKLGYPRVSKLALIYMEPISNDPSGMARYCGSTGLMMHLSPLIHPIELDLEMVPMLLAKAGRILGAEDRPLLNDQCCECQKLKELSWHVGDP